ncbi:family 78 glycoside hydrolase catalytic domain [Cohnella sp. GbtcB17]|uniref:family 78 glycoside hydrolase catalytic domain n=1 Tax=Cohnella sp. GbtcB17 TaxID=2824762 RepID=UPI001C303AF9|nr:family 78 glycoside hydrolase catalytic domain [Cohnella sp. GbtcB17]
MQQTNSATASDVPTNLRCEYRTAPLGIDKPRPKLGWETAGDEPDFRQQAYRIVVASSLSYIDEDFGDLWDSGKVELNEQNAILYGGAALKPATRYWWKVKVWNERGRELDWSEAASFETGLFTIEDWGCGWLNAEYPNSPTAVYYERTTFELKQDARVASARAYIGATGSKANAYELRINGAKVGEDLLSPGQTHFRRGLYRTHDVTDLLVAGVNAVGIMHTRKVIFRLDVRYDDGSVDTIVADHTWKRLKKGPYTALRYAGGSISEGKGETYDARLEPVGWDLPGYDDAAWGGTIPDSGPLLLTAQPEPILCMAEIRPVAVAGFASGKFVVDFGQNLFGTLSLAVEGPAGTRITLRYAERLGPDGGIDSGSIEAGWLAEAQPHYDEYLLRGEAEETYQPRFSCHGFRYVEVAGYPGALTADRIVAKVVHNDLLNDSAFACGSELLNRLHHGAVWSFRSNLVSVPMDCPTRERQGWLGDAHCHSEADLLNFDMAAFYEKWFDDIADCQLDNGIIPLICPSEGHEYALDIPWVSAVVFIPWEYYMAYGDKAFLSKHYSMMKRCLDVFKLRLDRDGVLQGSVLFGDWFGQSKDISKPYLASAYYYRCLTLFSKIANVLGYRADSAAYAERASRVRDGINAAYLKNGESYDNGSQTANALALHFGFVPEAHKANVLGSLVADIRSRGTMTVGCLGAEAILAALADNGRNDVAYELATNTRQGGWGYWVEKYGATTAFESFADDRSSNNHAFLVGGLDAWFYKHLAGISPVKPGYGEIAIKPFVPGGLAHASGQVRTVRGLVKSGWRKKDGALELEVEIPPNATANVHVPSDERGQDYTIYAVGSGRHRFTSMIVAQGGD